MTLPSSGQIGFSDIEIEVGIAVGSTLDMAWVRSNSKGNITNMDALHGLAWYQRNVDGNCNNGNCPNNCNCGNINCGNCIITGGVNCTNCDGQAFLQSNCNCACAYNCTTEQTSYNCNCDCSWICACACSDKRLKEDVTNITGALDSVKQLQGVYYKWNNSAGSYGKVPGKETMGVIANETQKIVPQVVGNYKDVLTVDYESMNALLLEAIKELDVKIESLRKV
jgi:hypothetical protein